MHDAFAAADLTRLATQAEAAREAHEGAIGTMLVAACEAIAATDPDELHGAGWWIVSTGRQPDEALGDYDKMISDAAKAIRRITAWRDGLTLIKADLEQS